MAEINLGKDETINATLSNVDTIQANVSTEENINAEVYDINYIPGYVEAEKQRRENEIARELYIANLEQRIEDGEFNIYYDAGTNITIDGSVINNTLTNTSQLNNDSGFITSSLLPTKTSDLTNDSSFVSDSSYVHTDNNYTTTEKTKLAGLSNYDDTAISNRIGVVEEKIPTQASSTNKLADKDFVNSSIATNTANFIGTFNSVAELEAYSGTITNNDYAFVVGTDSAGNTQYSRYKYNESSWVYEYVLNNSSFTAQQWSSINSGITSTLVTKINDIDNKYQKPSNGIPKTDLDSSVQASLGKADTALQAHQDISGKQNIQENTLTTTNKNIPAAINEVNSIAKGANQALSYTNYSSMVSAINVLSSTALNVGQNIMIVTVEVPDLWVSGVESTSSTYTYVNDETIVNDLVTNGYIQVGYYKLSMLETQKVDLTNYVTNTDYAKSSKGGVVKTSQWGFNVNNSGQPYATDWTYSSYGSLSNNAFISKGTLEKAIVGKGIIGSSNMDSALNSSSTNPVKNSTLYKAIVGNEITFQIPVSAWSEPSGNNFYNTIAIVTFPADTFIDNSTLELLNYEGFNNFAKHGFVLYSAEASSQRVWITAHDKPDNTIYLRVRVYNYE